MGAAALSLHLPSTTVGFSDTATGTAPTMSSREIADLLGTRHDDVKRSIERLAERGVITLPPMAEVSNPGLGPKTIKEYRVSKRDSYVVVAQLSPEFTARLVDRWQELEERTTPALPDLNNPLVLRTLLLQNLDTTVALQSQVASLTPKAGVFDRLVATDEMILISDGAKRIDTPIKDVFAYLRGHRWIYRRPGSKRDIAHYDKIRDGLLVHKYHPVPQPDGSEVYKEQVHLTAKGLAKLASLLGRKVTQ